MTLPFTIHVDVCTRFPLIQFTAPAPVTGYLMWLPVTKIQIEYLLCLTDDSRFDASWYNACLALNPRPGTDGVAHPWWGSFLTGIRFDEARTLSGWWPHCDMLTHAEWAKVLTHTAQIPASSSYIDAICAHPALNPRARTLLRHLEATRLGRREYAHHSLAHQMLFQDGLEEYVYDDLNTQHCAIVGNPVRPLQSLAGRAMRNPHLGLIQKSLGFRLHGRDRDGVFTGTDYDTSA